jgi:hypothetical protein
MIDKLIENKLIEKEQWKSIAEGTTAPSEGERVQASTSKEKMADAVLKMIEIQTEIEAQVQKLIRTKQDIISTIEQLKPIEYNLLHKMYIGINKRDSEGNIYVHYMDFGEVATLHGKSYSWATTTHGRALEQVRRIINQKGEKCET